MLEKINITLEPDICPYFFDELSCTKIMTLTELINYCSDKFQDCKTYKMIEGEIKEDGKI